MGQFSIAYRLLATAIMIFGLSHLSEQIAIRAVQYTTPTPSVKTNPAILSRRSALNQLGRATALLEDNPKLAEEHLLRIVKQARDPKIRTVAAGHLHAMALETWPNDHRRQFLSSIALPAFESAREHGVPPSLILGQAALESGWGRSALATHHNNLFGVKAVANQSSTDYPTLEFGPKGVHIINARFRTFESVGDAIDHHGRLLANDPRYHGAMQNASNWEECLRTLAPMYASDPNYVRHVSQIIRKYKLDRWDDLVAVNTVSS